jgi:hypothetical protein
VFHLRSIEDVEPALVMKDDAVALKARERLRNGRPANAQNECERVGC